MNHFYAHKLRFSITFFLLFIFYFCTSFIFLNRLFIETNITINLCDPTFYALYDYEPHFYREFKDIFSKNSDYKLTDVTFMPFYKDNSCYFSVKSSLVPTEIASFIDRADIAIEKNDTVIFQALKNIEKKELSRASKTIITHAFSYFFTDRSKGLLKLLFYSIIFAITTNFILFACKNRNPSLAMKKEIDLKSV